jgi:uncharacterized membrane protein YhaH (DUF805 family)
MNWYLVALENYFGFKGRARRKEYWLFVLFNIIFGLVAIYLDNFFGIVMKGVVYGPIYLVYSLVVFIPGLAVTFRRLHDVGESGAMILITLIPIIGAIWLLALLVRDSNPGENEYGPDPKNLQKEGSNKNSYGYKPIVSKPPVLTICKAYNNGRCISPQTGKDSGHCSWQPSDWQNCGVVKESLKYYRKW